MRILIVNNLFSGLRDGTIYTFIRHCSQAGDEIVLRNIILGEPIANLLADATDFDLVVAAGGDGTISAICYALRYSSVPILPFPAGTGNLLVTNLDLPDEPFALARLARESYCLDFDLAEITFQHDGQTMTRGFAVAAGAGFDAELMKAAEGLKASFGPAAYFLAALSRPNPVYSRFTLDFGDRVVQSDGIAVMLLNFAKIGPGLSIIPDNDARDGLLEVTVLKPHSTVELLPPLLAALLDRNGRFASRGDAIETHLVSSVEITSDPPLLMQYDGETPGAYTPCRAISLPAAARLVVTEQTYRAHNRSLLEATTAPMDVHSQSASR